MNTRHAIEHTSNEAVLSVAFNQDAGCFAVGLETGYCSEYLLKKPLHLAEADLYVVFLTDPCQLERTRDFNAGLGMVQMLGRTNILALVGGGKQPKFPNNKVILWNDKAQKIAVSLEFRESVLGVKVARTRVVVALHNKVHIYTLTANPERLSTFETADNPTGLCCISSKHMAFPGRTPGQVQLVEMESGNVSIIPAHGSSLRAMEISPDSDLIATASKSGTLIRVFSTSSCARIIELRRGVDPAIIYSLAFSPSSQLLAVTSDKSTLHIFDIPHPNKQSLAESAASRPGSGGSPLVEDSNQQKWGLLSKIPLLPRVFSDTYSFASAPFNTGDEPLAEPGVVEAGIRPLKGIIGWSSDESVIVLGAGTDGCWEKFDIAEGEDGRRICVRNGWKRYLGGS